MSLPQATYSGAAARPAVSSRTARRRSVAPSGTPIHHGSDHLEGHD